MRVKSVPVDDLKKHQKKNIICFGAGKVLENFFEEFFYMQLENNVKYIVDNNKSLSGTTKTIGKRELVIKSVEEMLEDVSAEDIILITTVHYIEVIRQLEQYERLKNISCCVYYFVKLDQLDREREIIGQKVTYATKDVITIPKKIHYCWFGKKEIPYQYRVWMESWKKYCPDYEIIEWNESNYDVSKNQYMKQAYENGKWAFVSDYARLDVVKEHGGVYLDTDVELIKSIDILLKNEAFCGFERKEHVNFGLGFGAVANHPIISELLMEYQDRIFDYGNGTLNKTPCPVYQTACLQRHGLLDNGTHQLLENITVYPEIVLCGKSIYSRQITRSLENTYAIHHFAGSWTGDRNKKWLQSLDNFYKNIAKV